MFVFIHSLTRTRTRCEIRALTKSNQEKLECSQRAMERSMIDIKKQVKVRNIIIRKESKVLNWAEKMEMNWSYNNYQIPRINGAQMFRNVLYCNCTSKSKTQQRTPIDDLDYGRTTWNSQQDTTREKLHCIEHSENCRGAISQEAHRTARLEIHLKDQNKKIFLSFNI